MGEGHETKAGRMTSVHLCNTHGELLFALSDQARSPRTAATLIYLDDAVPLEPTMQANIAAAFPEVELIVLRDVEVEAAFANLPGALPALVRRNLRWRTPLGWIRPHSWAPDMLAGRRFDRGYVYHSGFFMAKVVAGMCDRVILRECGLNNYTPYPVPPLKALIRLAHGLDPRRQFLGEEPWIDAVEVGAPENLPGHVRAKATRLTLQDLHADLPPEAAKRVLSCFVTDLPRPAAGRRSALLLTQPLDLIGICPAAEKVSLYAALAAQLQTAGLEVFVKNHPRETPFTLPGTQLIPREIPIEIWPFATAGQFDLGVALCSAALAHDAGFCKTPIQLVPTEAFNRTGFARWRGSVARDLARRLQG